MSNFRHILLAVFFVGLTALEIGHGLWRIAAMARAHETRVLGVIRSEHAELARTFESRIQSEREHAVHLARTTAVRRFLANAPSPASRDEIQAALLPYLASFRTLDGIALLDRSGRELSRCQRFGQGVGSVPPDLLSKLSSPTLVARVSAAAAGQAVLVGLDQDPTRVEVPLSDRKVLRYAAAVSGNEALDGILVVTTYAAPILRTLRQFRPVEGVEALLVDAEDHVLASRHDLSSIDESLGLDASSSERRLAISVSEDPRWTIVALVSESAVEASGSDFEGEYARILTLMVGTTLILALVAIYLIRLSVREVRLREAENFRARRAVLEEKLRISERLASLGQLTAGVAHEINNPLEGIGNYLALLEKDGVSDAKRTQYLQLVRHGFRRIREIVRDLNHMARPAVQQGRVDLAAVIHHAVKLSGYGANTDGLSISIEGLDQRVEVPGDSGRLEQVFLNLLLNAHRAVEGKGCIRIRGGARRRRNLEWIEIVVEDSGPGVPEALRERIFDPFFTTEQGSGLGLSISYRIVEAHGGQLELADSALGGAAFLVRLPTFDAVSSASRDEKVDP